MKICSAVALQEERFYGDRWEMEVAKYFNE